MRTLEDRYRRLLRWYPASWRTVHAEVVLGTLLDGAETEGRARPTVGEAWSIRVTGLGTRLNLSLALTLACAALLAAGAAQSMLLRSFGEIAFLGGGWLPPLLTCFVCPTLLTASALCLLRRVHAILPARAVLVLLVSIGAWALAFLTAWSWSVGFDEADAGAARSVLAASFIPLFLTGWAVGSLAVALLIDALASALPRALRWSTAAFAGVVAAPLVGFAVIGPVVPLLTAGAVIVVSAVLRGRGKVGAAGPWWNPLPHTPISSAVRQRVAVLASFSLTISAFAICFALTGGTWTAFDGTQVMRIGLGVGALGLGPMLLALGWLLALRRPDVQAPIWVGTLTATVGLCVHGVVSMISFSASGDFPWWAVLPVAIGLGVVTGGLFGRSRSGAVLIGGATATATFVPLWGLLVGAAFLAFLAGAIALVWTRRRLRQEAT